VRDRATNGVRHAVPGHQQVIASTISSRASSWM
jgi:hypothetical protein